MPQERKSNPLRLLSGQQPRTAPNLGGGLGTPDPPDWLPDEGKAEWRRITEACRTHPTWLQLADVALLTAYCATWATYLDAARDVVSRGALVPGRSSADAARGGEDGPALVRNPAVQIARDAATQLRALCRELGFSPDARGKVDLGSSKDQEPGGDLLSQPY